MGSETPETSALQQRNTKLWRELRGCREHLNTLEWAVAAKNETATHAANSHALDALRRALDVAGL